MIALPATGRRTDQLLLGPSRGDALLPLLLLNCLLPRDPPCEATHELVRQGIFTIGERNDPGKTDWAKAWPIMRSLYDRPDAPVLVEKQPCNLGKAATLRAHLEQEGQVTRRELPQ